MRVIRAAIEGYQSSGGATQLIDPQYSICRVPMTNVRMEELLKKEFGEERVEGQGRAWRIVIAEDDEAQPDEGLGDLEFGETEELPSESKDADSSDAIESDGEPADDQVAEDEDVDDRDGDDEIPGSSVEGKLPPVMVVMTDDQADRMRLKMPIREFDHNNPTDLRLALIALHCNYDRALDARYALKDGVLWSVFIHPLASLTEEDLKNGIDQVRALRKNTGTTFTGSGLLFGKVAPTDQEEEAEHTDF